MQYAHSLPNQPVEKWQTLEEHSSNVAAMAAKFAETFNSSEYARLIGLLHDLGKSRKSFQDYLKRSNGMSDKDFDTSNHSHSGAGALWIEQQNKARKIHSLVSKSIASCIMGHHAGLPDYQLGRNPNGSLVQRLSDERSTISEPSVQEWVSNQESTFLNALESIKSPPWQKFKPEDIHFWTRMLYSCLVDADFLDTEAFMDEARHSKRPAYPSLQELASRFFEVLDQKQAKAKDTRVNQIRARIRCACEDAATSPNGVFSLSVPTGGGKTLSSMAFALKHALHNGQKRIIYVIPYTSIIEQTADILRGIFGENNVLEHHSNVDPEQETPASRLASENWDAPIVVTTSVQFFESLYAYKSSKCRKIHNIANSVVIIDEAQLLPFSLLLPCEEAMKQLAEHYHTTVLLSTATQPSFHKIKATEIIPESLDLYNSLRRVEIELPENTSERRSWEDIAAELSNYDQVLCIVNTRKDCKNLHALMPEGTFCLSTLLCGAHRSKLIDEIKRRLDNNEPVRVISTQLIEAGVDIDFPVVYRAFCGLVSIIQSAGRCNREGRRSGRSIVHVFMPPCRAPLGELQKQEDAMIDILGKVRDRLDLPESFRIYSDSFYNKVNEHGEIFDKMLKKDASYGRCQYREAADAFRMIESDTAPVIVRYDNEAISEPIKKMKEANRPLSGALRKLQRHTVNVYSNIIEKMVEGGLIEEVVEGSGIYVQVDKNLYKETTGLDIAKEE